jgi:cytoskeletal protein RodZ
VNIGTRLRAARESAGLSRDQISRATKIKPERVEALEENAVDRLPGGIYLDGLIRAYAHEVGLDADALIVELHRSQGHKEPEVDLSELAEAIRSRERDQPSAGVRHTRALTAVLVALLFVGAGIGGYLYGSWSRSREAGATTTASPDRTTGTADVGSTPGTPENTSAQRTPGNTSARPVETGSPTANAPAARNSPSTPSSIAVEQKHRRETEGLRSPPSKQATTGTVEPERRTAPPDDRDDPQAPADPGVTGTWTVSTQVDASSLERFRGLRLAYLINLRQEGERVVGSGRKITENGTPLPRAAQTPITIAGTVSGDQLMLTFRERGARRESAGTFVLRRESDASLRGSFSSDAARSSGTVEAYKR